MICCSLLGIFPWQFMFEGKKRYQAGYALYSNVMLGYYISFLISAYIELFVLLNTDGELQMDAISANICITFIYSITITRQLIMKNSTGFRSLIKHIIDTENAVSDIQDSEVNCVLYKCRISRLESSDVTKTKLNFRLIRSQKVLQRRVKENRYGICTSCLL